MEAKIDVPILKTNISPLTALNDVGGTKNYNDLENIPSINEVPLKGDLTTKDLNIEIPDTSSFITKEVDNLSNYYDKTTTDGKLLLKADTSDIPDVSSFITNTVDNLTNYYKKSETYTQEQINELIGNISTVSIQKVNTLPTTGDSNIIYLLPNGDTTEQNIYDEYLYINNSWELIGSTEVDLTNYYNKNEIDNMLSNLGGDSSITKWTEQDFYPFQMPAGIYQFENPEISNFVVHWYGSMTSSSFYNGQLFFISPKKDNCIAYMYFNTPANGTATLQFGKLKSNKIDYVNLMLDWDRSYGGNYILLTGMNYSANSFANITTDPTLDNQVARKKYVDDSIKSAIGDALEATY